jgi:hypothetical protein
MARQLGGNVRQLRQRCPGVDTMNCKTNVVLPFPTFIRMTFNHFIRAKKPIENHNRCTPFGMQRLLRFLRDWFSTNPANHYFKERIRITPDPSAIIHSKE